MKLKSKIIMLSLILLSVVSLMGFANFGNQTLNITNNLQADSFVKTQSFGITNQKTYIYEITQNDNYFMVTSKYDNNVTYTISQNITFDSVITDIDQDRYVDNTFHDCVINFNDIALGNTFLDLSNGTYVLKGTLSGQSYSTNGLIYMNGADVEITDAEFQNNGSSCLIRNIADGSLSISTSTLTADDKVIFNNDGANITIVDSKIESKSASAIFSNGNSNITISEDTLSTEIIGNTEFSGAVYTNGGNLNILGGSITNHANTVAVYSTNAIIYLANLPTFLGTAPQIYTQTKIVGQFNDVYYSGDVLTINYGGTITSGTTVLVEDTNNENKFEIFNTNYDLKFENSNLTIYQIYSLIYNSNATNIVAPTDTNKYFINDIITLQFLSSDVRPGYTFLGWSETSNATTATYTENGVNQLTFTNQTIYAVWQTIVYQISYDLGDGSWYSSDENSIRYTYTCETADFVLPKPVKTYYTFLGWTCVNDSRDPISADLINNPNKTVAKGTIGNLAFTAHWELTVYNINYVGLSSQIISNLDLTTAFTIESPSITISDDDFLHNGYSFFGIYSDIQKTQVFNGEISFDILAHTTNPSLFDINGDINFYIDLRIFYNGQGDGSESSPYILSSTSQLEALLTGYKEATNQLTYIQLANDIIFENEVSDYIFEPLSNFEIDGNNNTIYVNAYNTFNNYISLFPYIKNCNFYDLNFDSLQSLTVNFGTNSNINFANIIGLAEKTNLKNIKNYIDTILINTASTQIINIKTGGIVLDFIGEFNTIDNCINYGNININIKNNNDINTRCGMIAGLINNSVLLNCANYGNVVLTTILSNSTIFETRSFLAGIAILEKDGSILNSYNQGNIENLEENNNLAVASGIAIIFNTDCKLYNNYNLGDVLVEGNYSTNKEVPIVWAGNMPYDIDNCYYIDETGNDLLLKDFTNGKVLRYLNSNFSTLESILENDFSDYDIELNQWYFGFDLFPQFEETILVYYNLNGISQNKSVVYYLSENFENKYIPLSYRENFFEGWYTDSNYTSLIDFANLTGPSISFYAKWTPLNDYVNTNFVKYLILDGLLLAFFLVALYLFDKKKTVKFYCNGKLVATTKVARTKTVTLPKGCENKLWFEDVQGLKPFINKKMSYKKLTLYTFNPSKQERMENKYYKDLDRILEDKLNKEKEKQLLLEVKKIEILKKKEAKKDLIAQRKQKQIENKEKQLAMKAEKQTKKLEQKKYKLDQIKDANSIDDKITIIKKEIKIIDTNEDK